MEKQKKVLNVIKGYMSKFDIEQVTIIEDDKDSVIFSGDVEKFLHPCETMQNEACLEACFLLNHVGNGL